MKHRLYLQIYAAFIAVAVFCLALAAALAVLNSERGHLPPTLHGAALHLASTLPPPDAPAGAMQDAMDERSERLVAHLEVWNADGEQVARSGPELPGPCSDCDPAAFIHTRYGPGLRMRLPDGRWLSAVAADRHGPMQLRRHLGLLLLLALGTAIGCYPVARRITGRLEALQRGVESWGEGELSTRVPVRGTDEVADLAHAFNRAADKVQAQVDKQRRLLASASHELRSPLARLRVALELMGDEHPELLEGAARDIEELDELIGDLLLAGRLDHSDALPAVESVDLRALLAEEAQRVDIEASGPPLTVLGNVNMLRRAVRNLLENAQRHGQPPVEARTTATGIEVADRGPGVPEAERERIFEPFYRPQGHREGADGGVGLGLFLVRQIAQAHKGDVHCEPHEGGGTRFVLTLAQSV